MSEETVTPEPETEAPEFDPAKAQVQEIGLALGAIATGLARLSNHATVVTASIPADDVAQPATNAVGFITSALANAMAAEQWEISVLRIARAIVNITDDLKGVDILGGAEDKDTVLEILDKLIGEVEDFIEQQPEEDVDDDEGAVPAEEG